jgi:hypothetical protein
VLVGVLESIDNTGCDDGILNSLVCLLFKILCEEGVRLDGRSDTQQFLEERKDLSTKVATRYDPYLVHLTNEILAFDRFLAEFPLLEVVTYLHAALNVSTCQE